MATDGSERVREAVRKRRALLAAVAAQPREKPALVDDLSVSRSTVDRGIDDLTGTDLVERTDRGFAATTAGELALDAYETYVAQMEGLAAARPVLNALSDAADIPPAVLANCEVSLPSPHVPENALEPAVSELPSADRLRGLAPVVKPSYVTLLYEHVVENDLDVEVVIEDGLRDTLDDLVHGREKFEELMAADSFTLLETNRDLPYALWVVDDGDGCAGMTVYEDGRIAGVIVNDDASVTDWYEDRYAAFRADAVPVESAGD